LELCDICTFCFEDVTALDDCINICPALPFRHLQVVLYPYGWLYNITPSTSAEYEERIRVHRERLILEWKEKVDKLNAACRRVSRLTSLLITLDQGPHSSPLRHPDKVLATLEIVNAAPVVYTEILGYESRRPFLLKAGQDAQK
jgi:hypothetical protein